VLRRRRQRKGLAVLRYRALMLVVLVTAVASLGGGFRWLHF